MPSDDEAMTEDPRQNYEELVRRARHQFEKFAGDVSCTDSGQPALGRTTDLPPPKQVGPYHIIDVLGSGGMGVVYLAEQHQPIHRRVALKLIKLGMDTAQVLARFQAERHALAMMNHPNIAKVVDAGTSEDGRPYFVMEYVAGERVTSFCDRGQLDMAERLDLFLYICAGLQHAHQKGVIHRDIKPSNILVSIQDDKPVPKIIDFGVAKAIGQESAQQTLFTEQGQLVGTPEYMSPEQAGATDADVDTRSDVYSLGTLLYELLVGVLPFDGNALRRAGYAEIQRIIREEEPIKPSTRFSSLGEESPAIARRRRSEPRRLAHQLRGDLDWIVLKALQKDASRRYATVAAMADDIGRYLRSEPVSAGRPSIGYRFKKFVRRNKGAALSIGTVFGVLVLATVVSTRFAYQERQANHETQIALAESAARAAYLSAQRGQWKAVLANADQAIELGHPDPIRMRLQKVLAWDALYDRNHGIAEIDRLMAASESEIGDHRGEVELWRGIYYLWEPFRQDDGTALIRSAIDTGLPPADEAYAQALIATNLPDAIQHLTRALRFDPFHFRASIMLGAAVMFNGDVETAISHFETSTAKRPEDPSAWIGIAICRALDGDTARMSDALGHIESAYDHSTLQTLGVAFASVIGEIELADSLDPASPRSAAELGRALTVATPLLIAILEGLNGEDGATNLLYLANFAPAPIARAWTPTLVSLGYSKLGKHDDAIKALESAMPLFADGFPRLLYAQSLMADHRFDEAAEAASYAANAPSMIKLQRRATYLALEGELARAKPDTESVLRNLKAFASLKNLKPETRAENAEIALRFGDGELARSIALAALKENSQHAGLLVVLAKSEMNRGAYGPAIAAATKAVAADSTNREAEEVLKQAQSYLDQNCSPRNAP